MRLIDADKMRENLVWCKSQSGSYDDYWDDVIERLDAQPTVGYNNHEVACIIADILGDDCACNWNNNDEWLPNHCEFRDTVCPEPIGVACWEQYLTNLHKRPKEVAKDG